MNPQIRLNELLKTSIFELKEIGIPVSDCIDPVVIVSNAKYTFGSCQKKNDKFFIRISKYIIATKGLRETMFHELLHTCPNCFNHGKVWKKQANYVNQHFGIEISRISDYEKKGIEEIEKMNFKYKIVCQKCGKTFYKDRRSTITDNPSRCKCTECKTNSFRVYSVDGYDITPIIKQEKSICEKVTKYSIICNQCGFVYPRSRQSNITKNPSKYRCTQCHGTLRVQQNF